jgi:hypothetical protein
MGGAAPLARQAKNVSFRRVRPIMNALALVLVTIGPGVQSQPNQDPQGFAVEAFERALGRPSQGEWETFYLEAHNRLGRDLEVTIRLEDESTSTTVSRRETFSRGARKRLFLYFPAGRPGSWNLRPKLEITGPAGEKLASGLPRETPSRGVQNCYQMALFSSDESSERAFGLPRSVNSLETEVARLNAGNFPDRWIGLACLDVIILHDAPLDELGVEQAEALSDYVRYGGTVVLSPGPNRTWLSHPVLKAIVKIAEGELEDRTELPELNSRFGRFTSGDRLVFHTLEGGSSLQASPGLASELRQYSAGFGRVIVVPFDLRRSPLASWPGLENFWTWMIAQAPRRFQDPTEGGPLRFGDADRRQALFRGIASLINPYPPLGLLTGLVILFLAAVGPANYLVLRRLRMTLLIVVTVPVISLAFLGLVLGVGYVLKGTSTVAYTASILRTRSGLDCARETTCFTLFSPATQTYDIVLEGGHYGLPLDRLGQDYDLYARSSSHERLSGSETLRLDEGVGMAFRSVSVGQWQTWSLESRALRPLGTGIQFKVDGGSLLVTNGSPLTISRGTLCVLADKEFSSPFGEVPAGKRAEFPIIATGANPSADLGLERNTLGGRLLLPSADVLPQARSLSAGASRRPRQFLLCLLSDRTPPVRPSASVSGASRSITLLEVSEAAP